ncbi:MAG: alpha/beta hydrolase [Proteobacteria bacterium]|nr:alpha/beta hydrolase [Pseudomonadota bacterium]
MDKNEQQENLQKIRNNAPRPFGLYTATCMGLDGGYASYVQGFEDSNFVDFCNGIKKYRDSEYIPKRCESKIIKKVGRVSLLEFAEIGVPILLVPSLINKYYIFDLYEDNSFIGHLISKGFRPFVIDWGEPTNEESKQIDLKSSVEEYILKFSNLLNTKFEDKVHMLGYCMGGTLALIAALKNEELYKSLTLVSTPVDFDEMPFTGMVKFYKDFYLNFLKTNNVSVEMLQTLFYMQDCKAVIKRIKSFATVKNKEQNMRMISLEDWLSDCVELESVMAHDCVDLWYSQNKIYHEDLDLSKLSLPCFVVTAEKDGVVPKEASLSKLKSLKGFKHISVNSGHIGVMVGRKSKPQFYDRICELLK